jgi:hypothetical protein
MTMEQFLYYVLKAPSSFLVLIIVTNIYQGFFGFDRSAYSNVKNGRSVRTKTLKAFTAEEGWKIIKDLS